MTGLGPGGWGLQWITLPLDYLNYPWFISITPGKLMATMFKRILLISMTVLCVCLVAAPRSLACVPGLEYVEDFTWEPTVPVSICVLPGASGAQRAFAFPGIPMSAELRFSVQGLDVGPDVPLLEDGPPALCDGAYEGLVTDPDGWVTFPFTGGGHRGPASDPHFAIIMLLCPTLLLELPTPVYFNSPDLSGDLKVGLSDVTLFAADFYGPYNYRSDFDWDGEVGLTDLVIMAAAMGATCP